MFSVMVTQLRRQPVRALTMLVGVLVATLGFTLLTGAVETSRLQVSGTVDANFRAAYDILVRPSGSRNELELEQGLVRPNFLSGQFGGITHDQYEQIAAMSGVEVAAPVAMVGYTQVNAKVELDLTEHVDPNADRQLLRVRNTWHSDRHLSMFEDPGHHYVYLTRHEVLWPSYEETEYGSFQFAGYRHDGEMINVDLAACISDPENPPPTPPVEVLPDGRFEPICDRPEHTFGQAELAADQRTRFEVFHLRDDGTFEGYEGILHRLPGWDPMVMQRLTVRVEWPMMLLLAAIDPAEEARLVGIDEAVEQGRYLRADDRPQPRGSISASDPDFDPRIDIPLLISNASQIGEQLTATMEVLDDPPPVNGMPFSQLQQQLGQLPGEQVATQTRSVDDAYRGVDLDGSADSPELTLNFNRMMRSGQPLYATADDGSLQPVPVEVDTDDVWTQQSTGGGLGAPAFAADAAFRPLDRLPEIVRLSNRIPVGEVVGRFDPNRLVEFSPLSRVPLETYQPASALGADATSQELLGGEALLPNSNPGGYLATPPQLLTTFASLAEIMAGEERQAPISAVRIRVTDDIAGLDPQSQERMRQLAEQIALDTGLAVDITIGSSPGPQAVHLPGGEYGRPDLHLTEGWSAKGLAVALVQAVDRKSLALFGLILVACGLFLGNAVSASVRVRRRELAILSCIGWPQRRITTLVLGEVMLVGLTAGGLAVALSWPLGSATGLTLSPTHALLAVPVAVGLATVAGLVPALRATRAYPGAGLHPPVLATGRARRRHTLLGLAVANLTRIPSRSLVGATALAVGAAAVTALLLLTRHFHGQAHGTLLGDAVSVQVRGVDVVAAVTTLVLGVLAIADALYLSVRERAAELATLRACGWSDAELGRMVMYEGGLLGAAGVTVGGAFGLAAVVWLTGDITGSAIITTLTIAAGGAALTVLATAVPTQLMRRLPLAAALAED